METCVSGKIHYSRNNLSFHHQRRGYMDRNRLRSLNVYFWVSFFKFSCDTFFFLPSFLSCLTSFDFVFVVVVFLFTQNTVLSGHVAVKKPLFTCHRNCFPEESSVIWQLQLRFCTIFTEQRIWNLCRSYGSRASLSVHVQRANPCQRWASERSAVQRHTLRSPSVWYSMISGSWFWRKGLPSGEVTDTSLPVNLLPWTSGWKSRQY